MESETQEPGDFPTPPRIRLQRFLATAGLGSRRECEQLIQAGRVEVDGIACTVLGTKVDPHCQTVTVDGEKVRSQKLQYFMLNKPAGVLSTNKDPDGRPRVVDLIKTDFRVFNVGRLDQSSEGLIVVTNDGELTFRLTHPKFGVEKRYLVQVVGCPTPEQLAELEKGVFLAEGKAKVESVVLKKRQRTGAILEMVLTEGRNREIRRLLARIGHKVTRLKRTAIGPLQLGELPVGAHRRLTGEEIRQLQLAAQSGARKSRPKPSKVPRENRSKTPTGNRPLDSKNPLAANSPHSNRRKEFPDRKGKKFPPGRHTSSGYPSKQTASGRKHKGKFSPRGAGRGGPPKPGSKPRNPFFKGSDSKSQSATAPSFKSGASSSSPSSGRPFSRGPSSGRKTRGTSAGGRAAGGRAAGRFPPRSGGPGHRSRPGANRRNSAKGKPGRRNRRAT